MRVIILLIGFCTFAIITNAQTVVSNKDSISFDSSHILNGDYFKTHFLWFTGHWNDKKNVFITTPNTQAIFDTTATIGGGGTTVTVSPQGTLDIQSSNADEWNQKVENRLKELQKFEDELKSPSSDAKEWGHHFEEVALPVLDGLQEEWKSYKIDSKELLSIKKVENEIEQQRGKELRTTLFANCEKMKREYDRIMAFCKAHKHDKEADLTYPPPPAYTYQCYSCDTTLEKTYEAQDIAYGEKFFKPESDMIKTCLSLMRQLSLIGVDKGLPERGSSDYDFGSIIYDAFNWSSKDPSKNGPCAYMHYDELNEAVSFLIMRDYYKAVKLFKDYRKNFQTARAVIRTLLSATRDAELWGLKEDEDGNLAECSGLISNVLDYYFDKKLLQEHDWSQLANIPFIYGLERQHQLLGGHESDLFEKMGKLLNSFHLNIDMDIKIGKENKAYQITHLIGKTKIAPEFDFANDTCYRWVAIEDKPNQLGFPVKKTAQKIECNLITNEFVAPGPHPVYAGTKNYYALLYGLKMDYCHPGKDTILLSSFIAEPNPNAGVWQIPMSPPQSLGTWQIEHMFQDVSTMKELVASGKVKQQAEIMKQQAQQVAAQMKSIQAQMANSKSKGMPNLDQLHKMQDMFAKAMNIGNNENIAPILRIDFPLQIKNNTATLHDKRYDAKEINPEEAAAIIYGYYTIKVVYEKQK